MRAFYATCTAEPASAGEAFPAFRDFVRAQRGEVEERLRTRRVQTNEVRRCAYLWPALAHAAAHFPDQPLALVEVGTSAGLNLLWDRYRYSYGSGREYGDPGAAVLIESSFRGARPAELEAPMPPVSHRIGLDLNIVDATDPAEAAWLRALIWPEQADRRKLFEAALAERRRATLDLREGDGFARLPELARELPAESVMTVYHTHVANQIPPEDREAVRRTIAEIGRGRDVIHVFNNILPTLHLTAFAKGREIDESLARTDGHARWIEWLAA